MGRDLDDARPRGGRPDKSGDYRLDGINAPSPRSAKTRARANLAAIHTLRSIEAEGREATEADQFAMSAWSGWGGLGPVFDESKEDWAAERDELRALLTDQEYAAARAGVLNAHYVFCQFEVSHVCMRIEPCERLILSQMCIRPMVGHVFRY